LVIKLYELKGIVAVTSYKALMNGKVIADKVYKADRFFKRMIGLMGKKDIAENEGLLIYPCRQIHTFFMRFPIDVLFLSKSGEILFLKEKMEPGFVSPSVKDCFYVLELKGGTISKKGIGLSESIWIL
jgi:uncharacterized membrane protein (UPF0127 family)